MKSKLSQKLDNLITRIKRSSLNIERHQMPQITSENKEGVLKFLESNGIYATQTNINPGILRFAQSDIKPDKVLSVIENYDSIESAKIIYITDDNLIVDGNHRVTAAIVLERPELHVFKFNTSFETLVNTLKSCDSIEYRH